MAELYHDLSDNELMWRVQSQDTDALAFLYRRYEDRLFRFLKRILNNNESDAEDVMQETFEAIYKKADTYDISKPLYAWLCTIARNKAISFRRKHGKDDAAVSLDQVDTFDNEPSLVPILTSSDLDPAEQAIADEVPPMLQHALSSLPDNQRTAVILHYYEGLTYSQIAEVMNSTHGTVASNISRGKERLREILVRQDTEWAA